MCLWSNKISGMILYDKKNLKLCSIVVTVTQFSFFSLTGVIRIRITRYLLFIIFTAWQWFFSCYHDWSCHWEVSASLCSLASTVCALHLLCFRRRRINVLHSCVTWTTHHFNTECQHCCYFIDIIIHVTFLLLLLEAPAPYVSRQGSHAIIFMSILLQGVPGLHTPKMVAIGSAVFAVPGNRRTDRRWIIDEEQDCGQNTALENSSLHWETGGEGYINGNTLTAWVKEDIVYIVWFTPDIYIVRFNVLLPIVLGHRRCLCEQTKLCTNSICNLNRKNKQAAP